MVGYCLPALLFTQWSTIISALPQSTNDENLVFCGEANYYPSKVSTIGVPQLRVER